MNATVMKTNNGKLIAAVMALAMIVCAVAVVAMPAAEAEGVTVTNPTGATAIDDATDFSAMTTGDYEIKTDVSIATDVEVPKEVNLYITEKGSLTITSAGSITVAGTVYNNVGKNASTSGLQIDGDVTVNGDGKILSVCAWDRPTGADATGTFTGTFTKVSSTSGQYTHSYAGLGYNLTNAVASNYGKIPGADGKNTWVYNNQAVVFVYGDITYGGANVTVNSNTVINIGGVYDQYGALTFAQGTTVTKATVGNGNSAVTLENIKAGNGGISFDQGSIEVSGFMTAAAADAKITQAIAKGAQTGEAVVLTNLNIVADSAQGANNTIQISGDVTVEGNVIVGEKVTLAIQDDSTLEIAKNSILSVSGTITEITAKSITNYGTLSVTGKNAVIPETIGGTGTVDTSAVASEGDFGGSYDTNTTYTQNQILNATQDIILVEGTQIIIEGTLNIPEGITMTIEAGAQLIVNASTGSIVNNGTIIIESAAKFTASNAQDANERPYVNGTGGLMVQNSAALVNNGTIMLEYLSDDLQPATVAQLNVASGTLTNNGSISVGEDSLMDVATAGKLVNSADATINMNGKATGEISNAGTVIVNGDMTGTVVLAAAGATVQVDYLVGNLAVNDSGIKTTAIAVGDGDATDTFNLNAVNDREANLFRIQSVTNSYVSGITVTSVIANDSYEYATGKTADFAFNYMEISGTVSATFVDATLAGTNDIASAKLTTDGPRVQVTDNLALAKGIVYELHDTLTVSGTVSVEQTATADQSKITVTSGFNGVRTPVIDITEGTVTAVGSAIPNTVKVNAASYSTKTTTAPVVTTYYYTTLANALASGATPITITGNMTIDEALTIPAGVTVNQTDGSTLKIADEGYLTIADTGRLNSTTGVTVDGSLYAENKRTGLRGTNNITSEVTSEGETDILYTNLVSALNNSESGDVIKLSGAAEIDVSVAIPEGVTLQTMSYKLTLGEDTVFTIDGTLYINNGGSFVLGNLTNAELNKYGEVVLNGTIQSETPIDFKNEAFPAGAYYSITTGGKMVYYLQPLEDAVAIISTVDQSTITVMGKVTVGDIAVTGTADENAVLIVNEKLTAGTITLSNAQVDVPANAVIDAVVADATGSVDIVASGSETMSVVSDKTPITVTGTVGTNVGEDLEYAFTVSGEVNFDSATIPGMTVSGTATIVGGTTAKTTQVNGKLDIDGTVDIQTGATLRVTGITTVTGTLNVAPLTTDGRATANLGQLFVGTQLDKGKFTADAAGTVTGPVSYDTAFVSAASEVPEDFVGTKNSTEFFVEDTLWMTVYGTGSVDVYNPSLTTSEFVGWMTEDEDEPSAALTAADGKNTIAIDLKSYEQLYAYVNYKVYDVLVNVDSSIGSVAIDGNMLIRNPQTGMYVMPDLTAGQHTVSYTLKAGYGGEATLASTNVTVSGMTFTLDGDYTDAELNPAMLSLGGATPSSGTVVIEGGSDGNSGMGLTDYLLIILVVLIVIMAIMVAMRLMRS